MKKAVFVVIIAISAMSFGQEAKAAYQDVMERFVEYYNIKNYQAIFDMCDANMQTAVPLSSFKQQLDGLHAQIGAIKTIEFINEEKGRHSFKVNHENMPLEYLIALNDERKIIGLKPQPFVDPSIKIIERNTTEMILPFNEEWFVFWGGTEVSDNYHVAHENQKYAYDIMMVKEGSSYKGDAKKNESYYVFGKDIIAPCNGKIVKAIDGVHDNIPGELNPAQLTGNTVVLETANKEYILFAHIKSGTVAVKEGQMVTQGELLGQCGNSGNSTEPHLHLSLQNTVSMLGATGGKIFFKELLVNGELKHDYLPVKGDNVKNIEN